MVSFFIHMPIYKSGSKYKIKNVKGFSKTKADAKRRMAAIKAKRKKK